MRKTDILDAAAERFKIAHEADRDERVLADEDLRFALNFEDAQWPSGLKKKREDDGRPCIVINKCQEKIDQVSGEFKQLKPSAKIRAVDNFADPKVADIISGLVRHIEYSSDANSIYSAAYDSSLYSGRGAWRIDIVDSIDDPFVKDIKISPIPNVLSVYFDPFVKRADLSDANYMFVCELVDKKQFERDYGKDIIENWPDGEQWDNWRTDDGYRVAEYWWKEKKPKTFYRVERQVGDTVKLMTVTTVSEGDNIVEERTVQWPHVYWAKLVAGKVIKGPEDFKSRHIPIFINWGKQANIGGKRTSWGMPRAAKDPQRMYNYWVSSATEQVALSPKSPYLVTPAMVMEYKSIWDQANEKNWPYLPFDIDPQAPGASPRREPPPQLGSAYQNMMVIMEHDIMSAMGIYAAQLGDRSNESSGVAIQARQRQGNIGSFPFVASFQTALTYSTKVLIDIIPQVYDTERVVRILGPDGEEDTVPINAQPGMPEMMGLQVPEKYLSEPREGVTEYLNDLTVGKYDVAVTIGPSYTTQREEMLAILLDMIKANPAMAQNVMDLIVQTMDMPYNEELVKRLRRMVPIGIRDPDPDEQEQQSRPDPMTLLEMAKLELQKVEVERKEFEAQVKAIAELTKAESLEVGQQLQAMTLMMQEIRESIQPPDAGRQQSQPDQGQPIQNEEIV